jgi:hypothetical protein
MGWKRGWAGKQQALRQLQGKVAIAVFSTALLFAEKPVQRRGKHVGSGDLPFGWTQFQGWKEVPAPLEFSRRILREGRAFPNFASLDRGRS